MEAKYAPPNDPVFQLVPPDFEAYVTSCFKALGEPEVNFETFWDVYCRLRDLVENSIPDDVAETLRENVVDDDESTPEPEGFSQMKEPVVGDTGVERGRNDNEDKVVEDEDSEEVLRVDFTDDEDDDELY